MRIAVFHNLPSGGAKRSLSEIVKYLSKKHQVCIFESAFSDRSFCKLSNSYNIEVKTIYDRVFCSSLLTYFDVSHGFQWFIGIIILFIYYKSIKNQINIWNPDIVLVFPCRFLQSPILMRYLYSPIIYFPMEPPRFAYEDFYNEFRKEHLTAARNFARKIKKYIWRILDKNNVSRATQIIAISRYAQEYIYHVYQRNVPVCHFGVNNSEFIRLPAITKENIVLSIGRLQRLKGHDFVLRSMAKVKRPRDHLLVIICDSVDPSEKFYLENLANKLGESIIIKEGVSHDELLKWYNRAKVLACGQVMEPFGLIVLEAMACGTPVVAVNEGGFRETIPHNIGGLLVDRDEQIFADALEYFLNNKNESIEWGKRARETVVRDWTWEATYNKIEKVLESVQ